MYLLGKHHIGVMIAKKMAVNLYFFYHIGCCMLLRNSEEDDDKPLHSARSTRSLDADKGSGQNLDI